MHKQDIKKKIKHLIEKDTEKVYELIEDMVDEYGDTVIQIIDEHVYGCHITDESMYEKAVNLLKNPDGSYGAKWTVEDIKRKSQINFEDEEYTEHDYAYIVNMMHSDYSHTIKDPDILMKISEKYLEDDDYPGDPSERAYHSAKKRIKYFTEK